MKKVLFTSVCLFALFCAQAQTEDRKWNVGVHTGYNQYSGDLGQGFYNYDQAAYGFVGLSGSRYLTKRLDASLMLTRGEVGFLAPRDYSVERSIPFNFRTTISTANLLLRYNLRSREAIFVPYVFAGGGLIKQQPIGEAKRKKIDFGAPTGGLGMTINMGETMALQVQEMFTYSSADEIDHRVKGYNDMYVFHTIGLTFNIGKIQRSEANRAGSRIDKCYEMGTGFTKKYQEPKKVKIKSKVKKTKTKKR
ncbi:MAG: hypothetical protein K0S12_1172 [Bacteroidetes bacterium]|jgi:hypothetical protein|nr:hypothetical protein [Bacteroidota bacterium]